MQGLHCKASHLTFRARQARQALRDLFLDVLLLGEFTPGPVVLATNARERTGGKSGSRREAVRSRHSLKLGLAER